MAGCRPLSEYEIYQVLHALKNKRDRLLFIFGIRTGFRISEILSLKVSDVYRGGHAVHRVKVWKRNMKNKPESRELPIHPQVRAMIDDYVTDIDSEYLFYSRLGGNISRFTAHKILKDAYKRAKLTGALATHSMRKSFAKKVYQSLNYDLVATQQALGHKNISNTIKYLSPDQKKIDMAILE